MFLLHCCQSFVFSDRDSFRSDVSTFLFLGNSADEYRLLLLAFFNSLETQTTLNLTVYATSAFAKHSLVSTVLVVQNVVNGKLS